MLRGKIVLYDFINDDADFKDSDKDFNNATSSRSSLAAAAGPDHQQQQGCSNNKNKSFMSRVTQM